MIPSRRLAGVTVMTRLGKVRCHASMLGLISSCARWIHCIHWLVRLCRRIHTYVSLFVRTNVLGSTAIIIILYKSASIRTTLFYQVSQELVNALIRPKCLVPTIHIFSQFSNMACLSYVKTVGKLPLNTTQSPLHPLIGNSRPKAAMKYSTSSGERPAIGCAQYYVVRV